MCVRNKTKGYNSIAAAFASFIFNMTFASAAAVLATAVLSVIVADTVTAQRNNLSATPPMGEFCLFF